MRCLKKNKQTIYYSLYNGEIPIYALDDKGNILTTSIDGVDEAVIDSYKPGYSKPEKTAANISFDSGETFMAEYGLNTNDYDAIITADKGKLAFDEQTLIWHSSEPSYDQYENVLPESAEYKVVAIKTSLNEERFILKKRTEGDVVSGPPSA